MSGVLSIGVCVGMFMNVANVVRDGTMTVVGKGNNMQSDKILSAHLQGLIRQTLSVLMPNASISEDFCQGVVWTTYSLLCDFFSEEVAIEIVACNLPDEFYDSHLPDRLRPDILKARRKLAEKRV